MDITARRGDTIINVHKDMAISNTRFQKTYTWLRAQTTGFQIRHLTFRRKTLIINDDK